MSGVRICIASDVTVLRIEVDKSLPNVVENDEIG
jgi:hypothetical protein